MTTTLFSSRRFTRFNRILALIAAFTAALTAQAAVWVSSNTFSADNLPYIFADQADINTAQSYAGPGGYYKLRAKFLVHYDPGYFHGTDRINNNGERITAVPSPGVYMLQAYWLAYDVNGVLRQTGPFQEGYVTVTAPATGGTGLRGDFFNGNQFNTLVRTQPSGETPNYVWGGGGPQGTNVDNFSVRWRGFIEPLHTQVYTFTTGSDDGMRVFVNNMTTPVAGAYYDHGYLESSGQISLTAGQRYEIQVEFFENAGGAEAKLFWQSASQQREIVPITRMLPPGATGTPQPPTIVTQPESQTANVGESVVFSVVASGTPSPTYQWRKGQVAIGGANGSSFTLSNAQLSDSGSYDVVVSNSAGSVTSAPATLTVSPTAGEGRGTGLRGSYYNGTNFDTLVSTRLDATVDFEWGNGSPTSGQTSDNFSVRWEGQVEAPVTGYYIFSTNADDGVRLSIGGGTVIDDWTTHPPSDNFSQEIYLTAGSRTNIVLEFFEGGGGAVAKLFWQPPGHDREIIPQIRLYSAGGNPGGWENILTETRTLHFVEEIDSDGNSTGVWSSDYHQHAFTLSGSGTVRIYTSGSADTFGLLYGPGGQPVGGTMATGGGGGNFSAERTVGPGSYYVIASGDYQGLSEENYTIYVDYRPTATQPEITSALSINAAVGASFSYQITAQPEGGVTYDATNLPPGLTVTPDGLISGTPYSGGTYSVTLTAANDAGSDTEVLTLTLYVVPPTCTISASSTSIWVGQTVTLTVAAQSSAGTIRDINIDQLSPNAGYYGVDNTGTEIPPNGESYRSPDANNHTRQLQLQLSTPGTYLFRGAVSDITKWYYSPTEVTVHVTANPYVLTVTNGSGDGLYPSGTQVAISADLPPSGQVFSQWTLESGVGTFANAASPNTTFTTGSSATTIRANYVAGGPPPTIVTSPSNQTVNAGQNVTFQVAASGSSLTYQWRKNSTPLVNSSRISGAQSATLVIFGAVALDAGAYDVVVTNPYGNATSNSASLVVNGATSNIHELIIHRP